MRFPSLHLPIVAAALFAAALAPTGARAHCDGLDGPVVTAARHALETRDVAPALAWVHAGDEAEVRREFDQAIAVRKLGPQARALADRHFFETVVRVHRAGEGAPYRGLKPAGRDLGPAIPAADRALETRDVEPLVRLVSAAVARGIRERFDLACAARSYRVADVDAGRAYVAKYVPFLHYVERLYVDATTEGQGHEPDADAKDTAHEE
jgi:hypothetical protein